MDTEQVIEEFKGLLGSKPMAPALEDLHEGLKLMGRSNGPLMSLVQRRPRGGKAVTTKAAHHSKGEIERHHKHQLFTRQVMRNPSD